MAAATATLCFTSVSLQAMLLDEVSELTEAEAQYFGSACLHAAGALQRTFEMRSLDVLQVAFEAEPSCGVAERVPRTRGRGFAVSQVLRQRGEFDARSRFERH